MSYKLFLDDFRIPTDCLCYMRNEKGSENTVYLDKWDVCKDYDAFVDAIKNKGLPELISFDHDLSGEHYHMHQITDFCWKTYYDTKDRPMTGYDCAKFLIDYCLSHQAALPTYLVHSMNPIGTRNIQELLMSFGEDLVERSVTL